MSKIRLSKFLKNSLNVTKSELLRIYDNSLITVNKEKVNLSYILKEDDLVEIDGNVLKFNPYVYYLYHKPRGIICTNDRKIKESYLNYINLNERVFCVGRLDKDSSGLMILTNDGDLFYRLLNPVSHVEKEYIVTTKNNLDNDFIENIQKSVMISGKLTKPCKAHKINENTFKIIITEGMYHQIRIMVKLNGNEVETLHRVRIGKIVIGDLKQGEIIKLDSI